MDKEYIETIRIKLYNGKALVKQKPGGFLYVVDFMINNDSRNIKRYNKYKEKYNKYGVFEISEGAVLRHHSLEWIHSLTSSFHNDFFEKTVFVTMNGNTSNGFCFMGRIE